MDFMNTQRQQKHLLFSVLALIIWLTPTWIMHDRFFPIQEWAQYYGLLANKGFFPYKDFYFFTQPISLFIEQFILKFGPEAINMRYWGLFERTAILLVIYFLLSREFTVRSSFWGTLVSMFLFQSYSSDTFYTYRQTTLLMLLLALVCLYFANRSKQTGLFAFAAGVLCSLAFFTKQSNGLFVVAIICYLLLWQSQKDKIALRLVGFGAGLAVPTTLILWWLIKNNAFILYVEQVFGGVSAKGSVLSMLFGFVGRGYLGIMFLIWSFAFFLLMYLLRKINILDLSLTQTPVTISQNSNWLYPVCALLSMGITFFLSPDAVRTASSYGFLYLEMWKYLIIYLACIVSIMIGFNWLFKKPLPFSAYIAEFMLASFVWMYASSLSYEVDISSVVPAAGIVVAFLLDKVKTRMKVYDPVIIVSVCLIIFASTSRKLDIPYYWWGWVEYGHTESVTTNIPALKGFELSRDSAIIYEKLYADIMYNTKPDDKVYTYPHITSVNYITGRMQPTFAPVDYYDVTPDNIAIMDADILRKNPPKMIVVLGFSEEIKEFHETAFRNGHKSGQREIEETINYLIDTYNYQLIDTFVTPGYRWNLVVYLKPDN